MPRWGLADHPVAPAATKPTRSGLSGESVRSVLVVPMAVLGAAASVEALVYLLLLINRTRLLNPWVANGAVVLTRVAFVFAVLSVVLCAVVLTEWLVARRAMAFAQNRIPETRSPTQLRLGCLVPLVNMLWAPVFVIELAKLEGLYDRLRKPIRVWWLLWTASLVLAVFATVGSFASTAQGIANNTETMLLSYLLALATVAAVGKVVGQSEQRRSTRRPAHHWVVIASDDTGAREPNRPVPESAPSSGSAPTSESAPSSGPAPSLEQTQSSEQEPPAERMQPEAVGSGDGSGA